MPNDPLPDLNTLPAGTLLANNTLRVEADTLGHVAVSADHLCGAETQRSLEHFNIAGERMPTALYHAYACVKKAAAFANREFGQLAPDKAGVIAEVCDEMLAGKLDDEFPLFAWQTGSGTQSHMHVNEVIANRAAQLTGRPLGTKLPPTPRSTSTSHNPPTHNPPTIHFPLLYTSPRYLENFGFSRWKAQRCTVNGFSTTSTAT